MTTKTTNPFKGANLPSSREEFNTMTPADRLLITIFQPDAEMAVSLKEADSGWRKICESGLLTDDERYAIFSAILGHYDAHIRTNDDTCEMFSADGTRLFDY